MRAFTFLKNNKGEESDQARPPADFRAEHWFLSCWEGLALEGGLGPATLLCTLQNVTT